MATTSAAPWLLPAPQLADRADIETAVVPLRDRLQTILGTLQLKPTVVTTIPSSPTNGDLIFLRSASWTPARNFDTWFMRYNSARPGWELLNTPVLFVEIGGIINLSSGTTMAPLGTTGPTPPFAGRYAIEYGATVHTNARGDATFSTTQLDLTVGQSTVLSSASGITVVNTTVDAVQNTHALQEHRSMGSSDLAGGSPLRFWGRCVNTSGTVQRGYIGIRPTLIDPV